MLRNIASQMSKSTVFTARSKNFSQQKNLRTEKDKADVLIAATVLGVGGIATVSAVAAATAVGAIAYTMGFFGGKKHEKAQEVIRKNNEVAEIKKRDP